MIEDTISAVATAMGSGGIGIIRLSGPRAISIAAKVFRSKNKVSVQNIRSFSLKLGHIVHPQEQVVIDQVLMSIMRAPNSYTGEDVVEINCHGGPMVMEKILRLTLQLGARIAEPGEFTKRAFLNGRIDLAQAEATIDVIEAKNDGALNAAIHQLQGDLSQSLDGIKNSLMGLMAQIEAGIDFPEEVGEIDYSYAGVLLDNVVEQLEVLLKQGQQGKVMREGIKTAIIGRTNVGKSSLLNALLKENRAIVTDIPGTTRDVIEETININNIPLKVIDTAGIRETEDIVESIGVNKAQEIMAVADLVLFVIDATLGFTDQDRLIANKLDKDNTIIVVNKSDITETRMSEIDMDTVFKQYKILNISAKERWGLEELANTIKEMVFGGEVYDSEQILVTRSRHLAALTKARDSINEAADGCKAGVASDLMMIDIKEAWESLGEITGETVKEDILDTIFKQFCIGK